MGIGICDKSRRRQTVESSFRCHYEIVMFMWYDDNVQFYGDIATGSIINAL